MPKKCCTCKEEKPITEFWKNKNFCKDCGRKNNQKYQDNGYMRDYMAKYLRAHPEKRVNSVHKDRPLKVRIYSRVLTKKRKGEVIQKPCLVCGNENVHGHHKDYNKPFELTWLCPQHHKDVHRGVLTV